MATLPPEIIGSLPAPIDEIEEEQDENLRETIIGSLPPPEHRIVNEHHTPDGKIVTCSCGWMSHLCHDGGILQLEWMAHLDSFE